MPPPNSSIQSHLRKLLARFDFEPEEVPEAVWEDFEEVQLPASYTKYACLYDRSAQKVRFNSTFEVFEEVEDWFTKKFPRVETERIREIIQEVYAADICYRIVAVEALADELHWDDEQLDRALHPATLTFCCLGMLSLHSQIATRVGGEQGEKYRGGPQ